MKYPDQWWARPLLLMEGTHSMRSLIHRVAAVVFMAVSVTHLVSLIVNRKLRDHWKEMLPNTNDPREALCELRLQPGLGDQPPARSAAQLYREGRILGGGLGRRGDDRHRLCCGPTTWRMKLLPKIWLDVATSVHFYEAVLATLAIVVWHFYSVIFDPDVYPLEYRIPDR